MQTFSAKIYKIGVNPYVLLPARVLKAMFMDAGKDKGHIPVKGTINEHEFIQHLVRYSGKWRLYLNTPMRKGAGADVGDVVDINISFDPVPRVEPMHPKLKEALQKNSKAQKVLQQLPPFRQKEILRYINSLRTEEALQKNIRKAIDFLLGESRFVGRDKP